MTTTLPRPPASAQLDDAALDALLRRSLSAAHDWVLKAPVPERLLRVLDGRAQG
ncbi:hypothetical protein JMJ55_14490 [Belnapia sp. T6]|uniref:Uncharacterized protein n=1 Tax=Belnapia mucosa TaxID=2804532 RepID=A0ABS1V4B0_9PROT|nr:hypothetical protein [Belnapia mucosa]MBL6456539.1 hypothetical protein [Belnapia mucosa]